MTIRNCKRNRNRSARMALVLIVTLAAGCANTGMKSDLPPDEVVRQRAQAWVDALLAGNLEGAWAYTSPNFREFTSAEQYRPYVQGSGRWTGASVDAVQCADEVCDVRIMIEYQIKLMKMSNQRHLDYKWLQVDGEWWLHVPPK